MNASQASPSGLSSAAETSSRSDGIQPAKLVSAVDASRTLLSVQDLRALGFGRAWSYQLIERLPHVCFGRKKWVSRSHFEAYLCAAAILKCDLWDDVRNPEGIWRRYNEELGAGTGAIRRGVA